MTNTLPKISAKRLVLFSLFTTLLCVALLVCVLEFGARVLFDGDFVAGLPMGRTAQATARHDAEIGWVNIPNMRTRIIAPEFECSLSINSKGLRDAEHDYEKPEGVTRVVLLGDSIAWGWGVDDGQDFADLAEAQLGKGVEIINFAVPGYSTDQQLLTLERDGWRYEPDLVLLCLVLNDTVGNKSDHGLGMPFQKPYFTLDEEAGLTLRNQPVPEPGSHLSSGGFSGLSVWLYEHSAFFQLAFPSDSEQQLVAAHAAAQSKLAQAQAPKRLRPENPGFRTAIEEACQEIVDEHSLTYRVLERLAQVCADRGVPLLGFTVCHHHDRYLYSVDFEVPERVRNHVGEYKTTLAQRFSEAGAKLGFATFAVDQAMLEGVAEHGDLHVGDGHLNARGNQVVAERLVEELRAQLGLR